MQRALAILVNHHAVLEQVVVEHARGQLGQQHIGLALHDQLHLHASARRITDLAQQAITGEEVRVGDHRAFLRLAQRVDIGLFDVVAVLDVVAVNQAHPTIALFRRPQRRPLLAPPPAAPRAYLTTALCQGEMMQVRHRRARHSHGIILLGFRAIIAQVIGGEVDPANERDFCVHHDNLAVQAAKPVGADAQRLGRRVKHLYRHPSLGQRPQKRRAQLAAAKAIEADHHLHATLCGLDQNALQLMADFVFEENEGLQQDLATGRPQRLKHLGEVRLAVLQQFDLVAALPAVIQVAGLGFVGRLISGNMLHGDVHSSISTDSGTWSDRWDQGRVVSTRALCTFKLRT